jgi:hypothetical protein
LKFALVIPVIIRVATGVGSSFGALQAKNGRWKSFLEQNEPANDANIDMHRRG